ncbi:hypothetical protein OCH239_17470 [Roseivivax halodurans JCM 10272]|uniref:DUF4345 domain-containing protein n=2 Tax=Roseivivax halodurans TaxID=93683 RepID=X7EC59_9RHOB|nr:hypothetical protein OCH239_17470 [Roseivivax halodurans JCM 10272]
MGLVPVALSYGARPERILPLLYGISEPDLATRHVFRAVMGLYFGMMCFWLAGALRPKLRITSLWAVFVFASGIASGRLLSLGPDGWPAPIFVYYLHSEVALAGICLALIAWQSDPEACRCE